jgi:hypothetical protein
MPLSVEQLLAIARKYWRPDRDYEFQSENSPEAKRFQELWEHELKKMDRWRAFLDDLRQDLPGFTIGNATATCNACFRCAAYPVSNRDLPTLRWAVVGCVSILAPVYTLYGVQYEYSGTKRVRDEVFFEPLPHEMRVPADVIARRIEASFEVSALPRELGETPVPLFVDPHSPPDSTLFHALFSSRPERVP